MTSNSNQKSGASVRILGAIGKLTSLGLLGSAFIVIIIVFVPVVSAAQFSEFGLGSSASGGNVLTASYSGSSACAPGSSTCSVLGCTNTYSSTFSLVAGTVTTPSSSTSTMSFCTAAYTSGATSSSANASGTMSASGRTGDWLWSNATAVYTVAESGSIAAPAGAVNVSGSCSGFGGSSGRADITWGVGVYTAGGSLISSDSGVIYDGTHLYCLGHSTHSGPWSSSSPSLSATGNGAIGAVQSVTLTLGTAYYVTLAVSCQLFSESSGGGSPPLSGGTGSAWGGCNILASGAVIDLTDVIVT
jgi:hypothetical protein